MTSLLEMAEVRRLLGMEGRETRLLVRRLRAIAEERGGAFPLFQLGRRWVTTRAALLDLVPELAGEDAPDLAAVVEHQRAELAELRRRIEALEGKGATRGPAHR